MVFTGISSCARCASSPIAQAIPIARWVSKDEVFVTRHGPLPPCCPAATLLSSAPRARRRALSTNGSQRALSTDGGVTRMFCMVPCSPSTLLRLGRPVRRRALSKVGEGPFRQAVSTGGFDRRRCHTEVLRGPLQSIHFAASRAPRTPKGTAYVWVILNGLYRIKPWDDHATQQSI